jgi:hypothetical protein
MCDTHLAELLRDTLSLWISPSLIDISGTIMIS